MSLWADYIRECGILEIIEDEYGWVTFHAEPAGFVFINDMYVAPEKRRTGHARKLLEQVFAWGKERGCTYCMATIHTSSKSVTAAVAGAIACGFHIAPSNDKDLILIGRLLD